MISERSVELGRFLRHYSVPLAHLIGEEVKTGEGKGFVPSSYSKQNLTGAWASWWVLSSMCLSCSTGQVCLSQSKNRPPPAYMEIVGITKHACVRTRVLGLVFWNALTTSFCQGSFCFYFSPGSDCLPLFFLYSGRPGRLVLSASSLWMAFLSHTQ